MEVLLLEFKKHFTGLRDRLECFYRREVQVEGWLKGEILFLLDRLQQAEKIIGFDREVRSRLGRKTIDIAIDLESGRHWVELKHWLIGRQKGVSWRVPAYITGLEEEFRKYEAVGAKDRGWVLVLCIASPGPEQWNESIKQFNKEYRPWKLVARTAPSDYPRLYFLGLLQCRGLDT